MTNLPITRPILQGRPHREKNIYWWGILMLVLIEITLFGLMIATYFYMRLRSPAGEWPPSNPDLLLPSINTVVLIVSGISMYLSDKAIQKGNWKGMITGQTIALLLAIVFVVLKYMEYSNLPYKWNTSAYGSLIWLMAGFHTAHVISVFLKGVLVYIMALKRVYTKEDHVAIEVNGVYWQFVVVIWIPLFLTIYISPYILGGR